MKIAINQISSNSSYNYQTKKLNKTTSQTCPINNKSYFNIYDTQLAILNKQNINFKGYYGDPQPVKKLVAIKRISVLAGDTATVEITIPKEELVFTGITMEKQLEKGWFGIMVGDLSCRIYVE